MQENNTGGGEDCVKRRMSTSKSRAERRLENHCECKFTPVSAKISALGLQQA